MDERTLGADARLATAASTARRGRRGRHASAVTVIVLVLASLGGLVARTGAAGAATGNVLWGFTTPSGPWNLRDMVELEGRIGKNASLFEWSEDFAHNPDFDPALVDGVWDQGAWPVLTWDPWDSSAGPNQPNYALARLIDGSHDEHIRRWARGIAAWGKPLMLRFAHEMNGDWFPWGTNVNGNRPGDFATAWRHVHDLFQQEGATKVKWVWSANAVYSAASAVSLLYPGDAYVDYVGVDGYNWGTYPSKSWQSFESVFGPTISAIRSLTSKPLLLTEVASAEAGGDKAAWIADFFAALKNRPEVAGFVWVSQRRETDWRIDSSDRSSTAFAQGVSDPRYSDQAAAAPTPSSGQRLFGVATAGGPWNLSDLGSFEADAGRKVNLFMWYQDFAHFPDFDASLAQALHDRGATPMLTWDPWDQTAGVYQPRYALARINDGTHDEHIRRWAREIAAWGKPLMLRFAHEMNGNWNAYSEGVNGNGRETS